MRSYLLFTFFEFLSQSVIFSQYKLNAVISNGFLGLSAAFPWQDHPVLRRPCFMLHPCQTAELLDLMLPSLRRQLTPSTATSQTELRDLSIEGCPVGSSQAATAEPETCDRDETPLVSLQANCWQQRYIAAWWSVVGPVVGLARSGAPGCAAKDGGYI